MTVALTIDDPFEVTNATVWPLVFVEFQTFVLSLIDSCQNRVSAKQYHITASTGSDVNFSRSLVFEVFS